MSIEGLSDQEKSVMLARAMGWEIDIRPRIAGYQDVYYIGTGFEYYTGAVVQTGSDIQPYHELPNLYHPANMTLAWRVLNWATSNDNKYLWNIYVLLEEDKDIFTMSPTDAQCLWLDKILTLAIEAGLVEVQDD